ncbi:MAG: peptidyl-prolyl cis-trans isomerase [Verrucomicrobia bacterium]|nr:peptidyl-prolyl cis-trans isomerase [Kiritimatiellia bacterium]MCO6401020.1 peptidyl-prolyl cis-trans isomerase [Verrucomicrobiota bacterium]
MRTFSIFTGAFLIAGLAFANTSTNELPADGYAAIVNARVITVGDVLEFVQAGDLQMRDEFAGAELARRRQEAYNNARDLLIEQALIVEDFKKLGGAIPDRVVDDRIKEFIFERFDNSRAKFLEALAEEQITLDEWRTRVRERLIVSILRRQEVTDRIKITPGALQKAYDGQLEKWKLPARIHVRLIALPLPESDDALKEDQRQIAIRARGRILAGESFADVAQEVSQDSKAAAGGDWGWRAPSDFSADLRDALKKLPTGEVSDIIETPAAIYLALVEGREAARQRTLDEVRPEIERSLRQAEAERLYSRWMERLKKKYFVQVF